MKHTLKLLIKLYNQLTLFYDRPDGVLTITSGGLRTSGAPVYEVAGSSVSETGFSSVKNRVTISGIIWNHFCRTCVPEYHQQPFIFLKHDAKVNGFAKQDCVPLRKLDGELTYMYHQIYPIFWNIFCLFVNYYLAKKRSI